MNSTSASNTVENFVLEKQGTGLGFTIRGGKDSIHVGDDPGIFVTSIKPNGAAARSGRINPGDKILEIDGHDLRSVFHNEAVQYFHQTSDKVAILIDKGAEDRLREELSLNGKETIPASLTLNSTPYPSATKAGRSIRFRLWIPVSILLVIIGVPCCYYIYKRLRHH